MLRWFGSKLKTRFSSRIVDVSISEYFETGQSDNTGFNVLFSENKKNYKSLAFAIYFQKKCLKKSY